MGASSQPEVKVVKVATVVLTLFHGQAVGSIHYGRVSGPREGAK